MSCQVGAGACKGIVLRQQALWRWSLRHNALLLQGVLRTRETLERFKRVPTQPGQTSPLLIYFGTILTKSSLNAEESVELGRLVMAQNKKVLLDNWWKVGAAQ